MKNIIGIVQARTGSKRLPGKVLKKIGKYSLIELLLKRLSKSKKLSKVVLATTKKKNDDYLTSLVSKLGYEVYRGSEDDVLSRYFKIAQKYGIQASTFANAFVNDRPFVTSNIIGATNMTQLKENIDSIDISLSKEILKEIEDVHLSNPNPCV